MSPTRSALIVANYDFQDPGLRRLRAPAHDAEALAGVLGDPDIGAFDVRTVLNQPSHLVDRAIEGFFANRGVDDLLLLHFSGHGVKDETGDLYFAAADTDLGLLGSTAVSSDLVNRLMSRTRARRVVLLLDCCYAGAFARGMATRGDTSLHLGERLGGRGRAVITASTAMEYAFEGSELADTAAPEPSVFTSALVEGLRSGEADSDQDGFVGLDELYEYVFDRVRRSTPNQTPSKWTLGLQGELVIARRSGPVTQPAAIPESLVEAAESPFVAVRRGAVQELATMLRGSHEGRALAARQALEGLRDDDSRSVAEAAAAALADSPQPATRTVTGPLPSEVPRQDAPRTAVPRQDAPRTVVTQREAPRDVPRDQQHSERVAPSTPSPGPDPRRRSVLLGAGGVAAAVLLAVVALPRLVGDEPASQTPTTPRPTPTGSGGDRPSRLPDTSLALHVRTDDGDALVAIGLDGSSDPLAGPPAYLPTISPDRAWIVYMVDAADGPEMSQPVLVRSDGSDGEVVPLEDTGCAGINRPAWSPDGSRLAVVCKESSRKLLLMDLDGTVQETLEAPGPLRFSPTWGTVRDVDGTEREVIVVAADNGDDATTQLLMFDPEAPQDEPAQVPNGRHLDSHPDLDDNGRLLFLRQPPGRPNADGELRTSTWDGTQWQPPATEIIGVKAPTWGPKPGQVAYLEDGRLWVADVDDATTARPVDVEDPGKPAWGSR